MTVGGATFTLVLRVDGSDAEVTRAAIDSPDQGAFDLPVEGLTVQSGLVRFAAPTVGARFEGRLSDDGATLTGTLTQGAALPLVFTRTAQTASVAAPARPQHPLPPFPYRAEEVSIETPTPGVSLAGTLTLPSGPGPFPAALLITGSGIQDRDETIFSHKPFLVIADALTRRGIAVLRVDDRGVGGSTGDPTGATTADFASDARAAFAWLANRPDIVRGGVGLIGHSEGGTIAPMVAATDPRVAFVVMIAGPAVPGDQLLTEQSRRGQLASGLPEAVVAANTAVQASVTQAMARHADDPDAAAEAVRAAMAEGGAPPAAAEQAASQARRPWLRWFVAHDPRPGLVALKTPLLAVYGGKDVQVPAEQSAAALRELAPGAEIVVLPDLNHLMQTAATGLPAEYPTIEETFSPEALNLIVNWVARTTGVD